MLLLILLNASLMILSLSCMSPAIILLNLSFLMFLLAHPMALSMGL